MMAVLEDAGTVMSGVGSVGRWSLLVTVVSASNMKVSRSLRTCLRVCQAATSGASIFELDNDYDDNSNSLPPLLESGIAHTCNGQHLLFLGQREDPDQPNSIMAGPAARHW